MSGNQLRLARANGCYSPGCTVYLKTWLCCNGVVDLFVRKRGVVIILLLPLGLVWFCWVRISVKIMVRFSFTDRVDMGFPDVV